jgi:hypothetical protein
MRQSSVIMMSSKPALMKSKFFVTQGLVVAIRIKLTRLLNAASVASFRINREG